MKTYLIWRPQCVQTRADAQRVEARGPKSAAERWAAEFDKARLFGPGVAGGANEAVFVALDEEGSEAAVYVVSGSIKHEYSAKRML